MVFDTRSPRLAPVPIDEELKVEIKERDVWLKVVTSHFRDGDKWRFTDGGENPFTATMADREFIKRVQDGKITLSATDTLRCVRLEPQRPPGQPKGGEAMALCAVFEVLKTRFGSSR